MKTLVAVFSMFIFSIFADYSSSNFDNQCGHCHYVNRYESASEKLVDQPIPYIQDLDSNLVIYPILENNSSGERYIRDLKFIYKDKHYCSDLSKITFISSDTAFSVVSLRKISCKIVSIIRIDNLQAKILSKTPVKNIIVENLATDNIYNYRMNDSLYFVKAFKLDDFKQVSKPVNNFTPKKSGFIK